MVAKIEEEAHSSFDVCTVPHSYSPDFLLVPPCPLAWPKHHHDGLHPKYDSVPIDEFPRS